VATNWDGDTKFNNALTYFENQNCTMCIVCGDLTQTGFYRRTNENDASTTYFDEVQFSNYKEICDRHTIPIYEIMGNHESYYGMPITNNLDKMNTYTGKGVLAYTVAQGNDLFIFVGQPRDAAVMSDEDLQWLYETLEANRNKRCFVIIHSHIDDNVEGGVEDSGNPDFARENSIFGYWGATKTQAFMNLMAHYKNTILFHGHTHLMFEGQQYDESANYTEKNGFKSVHCPSGGSPRWLNADGSWTGKDAESQGYIVDVYADCVVLNGMDLINKKPVPLGVYKLDTTLKTIKANTFTDSTGTITT
jgi:predicted phosphodiesterase